MKPRAPRGVLARAWTAIGVLLSRDVVVVTNAIAFNFLLCLFPLLLVLVAAAQQLGDSRRISPALLSVINELIPFEQQTLATSLRSLGRMAKTFEVFSLVVVVWGSSGIFTCAGYFWETRSQGRTGPGLSVGTKLQCRVLPFSRTRSMVPVMVLAPSFTTV